MTLPLPTTNNQPQVLGHVEAKQENHITIKDTPRVDTANYHVEVRTEVNAWVNDCVSTSSFFLA